MTPIRGGGAAKARVFQLFYEETFLPSFDSPQIPLKRITARGGKINVLQRQLVEDVDYIIECTKKHELFFPPAGIDRGAKGCRGPNTVVKVKVCFFIAKYNKTLL